MYIRFSFHVRLLRIFSSAIKPSLFEITQSFNWQSVYLFFAFTGHLMY